MSTNNLPPTLRKSKFNICFRLLYLNVRSVLSKLDKLIALCSVYNYHVVCIVESWLSGDVSNSELYIPGYEIFRRDRDRHGGGILIFVKSDLCPSPITYSSRCFSTNLEFFQLTVEFYKSKFCIAVFYRPPSSDVDYFDTFCNIVENLDIVNFSNFILVGDFNIDYLSASHHLFPRLKCLCELLSLHQVVTEPTHSSPSGNQTLIDHVFVSDISHFLSCTVFPPLGNSDHNCVDVILSLRETNTAKKLNAQHTIWRYALADFERANEMLSDMYVDEYLNECMDQAWSKWKQMFMSVMSQCIPTTTVKLKNHPPWLSHDLLKAIRSRDSSYRRARKTGNAEHLAIYKKKRNKVANMMKSAKTKFFDQLDPSTPKAFWKTTRYLTKQHSSIPLLKDADGRTITADAKKATMLNDYFT